MMVMTVMRTNRNDSDKSFTAGSVRPDLLLNIIPLSAHQRETDDVVGDDDDDDRSGSDDEDGDYNDKADDSDQWS